MTTKKYILIAEDERTIAQLYKTKFELSGYEVETAENGIVALAKIKERAPDLLLVDIRMPKMSGDILVEKVRTKLKLSDLPIIILTNISREEAPRTLVHHRLSGYFVKAHQTPSELLQEINKVLAVS